MKFCTLNTLLISIFEKFFTGRKCWKYVVNLFLQTFRLFTNICLFFLSKTLLITIPTIKPGSSVKNWFWNQEYSKITGNRYLYRFLFNFSLYISSFFQSLYVSYFTSFSISIQYLSLVRSNMHCACLKIFWPSFAIYNL